MNSSEREWLDAQSNLPVRVERNRQRVIREFWPKVQRFFARIPFMDELLAAYYAAMDAKTPMRVRGTLLAALAYFIMPLDFVPDVVLGLGFTDDLTVLMLALKTAHGAIKERHRVAAREKMRELRANAAEAEARSESLS